MAKKGNDHVLVIINSTLNYGSTGTFAEQVGIRASSEGWDVYYAHGARYVTTSNLKTIQIGTKFDNYFHALIGEILGLHGLGSILSTFLFVRYLKKINPSVVHLHNIHGYYINYKILFKYLSKYKIPVVWTFHDCWSITGHCTHFVEANCEKWKSLCYNCPLLKTQYKSLLFDNSSYNYRLKKDVFTSTHSLTIAPVSRWVDSILKDSFLSNCYSEVIYLGIDLDIFKPTDDVNILKKYNLEKGKYILAVSSKGLSDLKSLANMLPDGIKLMVVGLNNKEIDFLPSSIVGVGYIYEARTMVSLYTGALCFVNPTEAESFGLTSIEAQACGTPSIVYNVGGAPESVSSGTGYVVESGDVSGILEAINEILSRGKETYKEACVNFVKTNFNRYKCVDNYLSLYSKMHN